MLTVGLFVPCYIDQFYPQVAIACLKLLEKLGCRVIVPPNQTCCGQPLANSGFASLSRDCDLNFIERFSGLDYIVSPSGSCVLHIKEHLSIAYQAGRPGSIGLAAPLDMAAPPGSAIPSGSAVHSESSFPPENATPSQSAIKIRQGIYELTEFLTDILKVNSLPGRFPFKVGLHNSCHGQRGLHLSSMSELMCAEFSKPAQLLNMVDGLELCLPERKDECCGFGGTFCVFEEAVSVKMGKDRIREHEANGVHYITGVDMSCLMHLQGILKRGGSPVRVIHIAEILEAGT